MKYKIAVAHLRMLGYHIHDENSSVQLFINAEQTISYDSNKQEWYVPYIANSKSNHSLVKRLNS